MGFGNRSRSISWAVLLVSMVILAACSQAQAVEPTPLPTAVSFKGTIVALGDSLTEGLGVEEAEAYPAQLEHRLLAAGYPYRVVNAGVSGETSSGARSRLEWIIDSLQPDIVILETGGNDGLRGVEPELTLDNIQSIVETLQERDIVVILAGMKIVQNMGREYTTAFEAIYPAVAAEQEVILIPFFLETVAAEPAYNQEDGIHPNAAGYEIVVDNSYPYVIEAIEALGD